MGEHGTREDLLLEIGCEEIPARFIPPALADLKESAAAALKALRLEHGEILTAGTPRRLAICVRELSSEQPDLVREVTGPARSVAYGPDGSLTRAGSGFARSVGVAPEELSIKSLPKGEYVSAMKREEGRPAEEILREELPRWITALRFPKSMRWGEGDLRFARPIHWILALCGGKTVEFEVAGIRSGDRSRGHRFLSPGSYAVEGWKDYLEKSAGAFVIADVEERRGMIREQIEEAARAEGGEVSLDEELLDTVTNLVEYPVAVCGSFDEEFLALPDEVLITSMKSHQKYFTVRDGEGSLMARFIAVSNMRCEDMALIREGNERVLRARLADADFFFREDGRKSLAELVPELEKVVYQEKIGTYREKVDRVEGLARYLAKKVFPLGEDDVARAARLGRADLVTLMVGEFPELQGIMGREYAARSGEKPQVATAVYEQYLPRFSGDDLPGSELGAILSVADRADTIAGIFGIGEAPTGSEDPYGLRRHTLAVINILTERDFPVDLTLLLEQAVGGLRGKTQVPVETLLRDILEFFRGRMENLYSGAGFPPDIVRAVLAAGFGRPAEVRRKIGALEDFRREEDFLPLAMTFKRAVNIVPDDFHGGVDPSLFREEEEKALHEAVRGLEEEMAELIHGGDYREALRRMASVRPALDAFFDKVLVMAEEEDLRANRLALVKSLASLFAGLADFRQISA
jgi:glycyl-tRNA synthetase beta chain